MMSLLGPVATQTTIAAQRPTEGGFVRADHCGDRSRFEVELWRTQNHTHQMDSVDVNTDDFPRSNTPFRSPMIGFIFHGWTESVAEVLPIELSPDFLSCVYLATAMFLSFPLEAFYGEEKGGQNMPMSPD
jgi:hypothetical protein